MARTKNIVSAEAINKLKESLQQVFGKTVSQSMHCIGLSRHIQATTGEYISAQTLRRIFGFIASPFAPSTANLDILSKYCGYASWANMVSTQSTTHFQPLSFADEASLYLNFFSIDLKEEADFNYHNACRNIAERILNSEVLFNQLAAPLAENKAAQIFFYERFPFIDGLGGYYQRGVRLYLNNKKDIEAQIYGNSLLMLGAILTNNRPMADEQFEILSAFPVDKSYHPFVIARLLGSKILYKCHFKNGDELDNELKEIYVWSKYFSVPSKINIWIYPYYQMMMCNYLNLSGLYEQSEKIMRVIASHQYSFYQIEKGYKEILEVVTQIGKFQSSPKGFLKWFHNFDGWIAGNRIFKKYFRLQTLVHVYKAGNKKDKKVYEECRQLIDATGFTFFLKHFE